MVCRFGADGELVKVQMAEVASCALFEQEIVGDSIRVKYIHPEEPVVEHHELQDTELEFPLEPETDGLERAEINLHSSLVSAYRVGQKYDDWFTACFGFKTTLLYIGNERRPIFGTFSPRNANLDEPPAQKGWLSSISSYVTGGGQAQEDPDWLTFSDCAPLLVATEASLRNVRARVESGQVDIVKFRPNIVVDGRGEWEEDFWAALSLNGAPAVLLTKLCNRCNSLNINYKTGRYGKGDEEDGKLLKVLMKDRRVDLGLKYSPSFGRYGFLADGVEGFSISVGDDMEVTKHTEERPVWDWPGRNKAEPRYYRYTSN